MLEGFVLACATYTGSLVTARYQVPPALTVAHFGPVARRRLTLHRRWVRAACTFCSHNARIDMTLTNCGLHRSECFAIQCWTE
jgi:hypothetical protein